MGLNADALRATLAELRPGPADGPPAIAACLRAFIAAHGSGASIAELYDAGPWVHIVLKRGDPRYWEIDCLSPNAFRMYPGFERPGHVAWANVWVRGNMDIDELVETINDVVFRDETEESGNA